MAVAINLTSESSNLLEYFGSWADGFTYRGHGLFSPAAAPYDQWYAGNEATSQSSIILEGDGFTYTQGNFNGNIEALNFGDNLAYDAVAGEYVQDVALNIDLSDATLTSTFTRAIYVLSNYGSLEGQTVFGQPFAGLYDYFAEQGTVQTGNAGINDVLVGFGGQDTFVFQDGSGWDTVNNFDVAEDILDVSAWGASSLDDLTILTLAGNTYVYGDVDELIIVNGVSGLTAANFEFAPSLASELLAA